MTADTGGATTGAIDRSAAQVTASLLATTQVASTDHRSDVRSGVGGAEGAEVPFRPIFVDELAPSPAHEFRADIQGLRAIAVLLTLVWHAGFSFLPHGYVGVDAFFVISGFLITGLIIKERTSTGKVNLREFYARRARRLLPASALVIVVTIGLSLLLVPQIRWSQIRGDALASAFYVENWRLAGQSIDYVAQDAAPSPFQHYWSLAVEEQFYLLWPLLIMLCTPRGSLSRGVMTRLLTLGIGIVCAASFVWSVVYSQTSPGQAYFVTTTRAWEFALGALAALLVRRPGHSSSGMISTLGRRRSAALAWLGLAMLIGSAIWMPAGRAFPGYVALAPTIGTALVLVFGIAAGAAGPQAILGRRPVVFIGTISYSLYLWHWPLLVVAEAKWGTLQLWQSAAVVAGSALPAYAAYRLIETPGRRWIWRWERSAEVRQGLLIGIGCTVVAAAAGLGLGVVAPSSATTSAETEAALAAIEATVLDDPTTPPGLQTLPTDIRNENGEQTAGAGDNGSTEPDDGSTEPDNGSTGSGDASVGSGDGSTEPGDGLTEPGNGSSGSGDGSSGSGDGSTTPGLGALSLDEPAEQASFVQPDSVDEIVPDPLNAATDVSDGFCRQGITESELLDCLLGDPAGQLEMALVGDSHAAQWTSTFDAIARARGWRLRIYSKAACNYTALKLPQAGQDQQERQDGAVEYVSCTAWNANVHQRLLETRPAVIVITGREPRIWTADGTLNLARSRQPAIDDKVARWGELIDNGSKVIALASTPIPAFDMPECVSENRSSLTNCTFERADAVDRTGGSAQAAASLVDAAFIDVNNSICPGAQCPVVVGGILVYRDPTHLTDSYARTMTPIVNAALDSIAAFDIDP